MGQDSPRAVDPFLQQAVEDFARSAQRLSVLLDEDKETRNLLWEYGKYLLGEKPRNYHALAKYLEYYGQTFLLAEIEEILQGRSYSCLVEVGPGTGWLVSRLRAYLEWGGRAFAIDKRDLIFEPHARIKFILQDLEAEPNFTTDILPDGPPEKLLVIANQFLHCVENWQEIIRVNRAEWLVVEVDSLSWRAQMRNFGASPISKVDIGKGFMAAGYVLKSRKRLDLVSIYLWRPEE